MAGVPSDRQTLRETGESPKPPVNTSLQMFDPQALGDNGSHYINHLQGADLSQTGKYRGLTRLEAALMRKFSHTDRLREILENRGRCPPPDFADIQKVFYELHQTNEFQDKEFL